MAGFHFDMDRLNFTKSERKIIDYIYQNISLVPFMSIERASDEARVSIATMSRFVRHAGYRTFKELKSAIMEREHIVSPVRKLNMRHMWGRSGATELLGIQERRLADARENLPPDKVVAAVLAICSSPVIYLLGIGEDSILSELMVLRLSRLFLNAIRMRSSGPEFLEDLAKLKRGDLVILFCFHEMSAQVGAALEYAGETGAQTLLFTGIPIPADERAADISLHVCQGGAEEYNFMSTPVALIEAIAVLTGIERAEESARAASKLQKLKEKYPVAAL